MMYYVIVMQIKFVMKIIKQSHVHFIHPYVINQQMIYVHQMVILKMFEWNKVYLVLNIGNYLVNKILFLNMITYDVYFVENLFSHYRREGEIERDVKGDSSFEVVAQEITTFLILVGIYFPSVTGNKIIF